MQINRDQFLDLIQSDPELAKNLTDLYKADWPKVIEEMDQALSAKDSDRLMKLAHRVKSAVRNFFAVQAADDLQTIESLAKEGHLEGLEDKLREVHPKLELIQLELEEICSELGEKH